MTSANLFSASTDVFDDAISPFKEMGAYEALSLGKGMTFKALAKVFSEKCVRPSDMVEENVALEAANKVMKILKDSLGDNFGVRVHGTSDYPQRLRDARDPLELFYYSGYWDLIETKSVAVVGTRNPSREGVLRTQRLTKILCENNYTIVSGLADGVDRVAHSTAIECGGNTIGVLGTPLSNYYPARNRDLQIKLAKDYLLISQVPVLKYMRAKDPRVNRHYFPERNKTMSAITLATIIVEAGNTSGTLIQARAALEQGRKLFILDSCFENPELIWPQKFLGRGAIRVKNPEDILENLQ